MTKGKMTFSGGIKLPGFKEMTRDKSITQAKEPEVAYIVLQQHIGAPSKALVEAGDYVKVGQKIGEAGAFVSANIYSSVSGTVREITICDSPSGQKSQTVIIDNDFKNEKAEGLGEIEDLNSVTSQEIKDRIAEAGIVGMGGATFPTHVKLSPPEDKKIEYILINGAECEPYLNSDYRLLIEETEMVVFGLEAILKATEVNKGIIVIEDDKPLAIESVKKEISQHPKIELAVVKAKYPQGDEKRIIKSVLNRVVPSGGLPMEVGCIVQNVGTTFAIGEAVRKGKPLYERVVTVTGSGVKEPSILRSKIGTPFIDLIKECGGFNKEAKKVISGGPMMGISQANLGVPITKGSGGILVFNEDDIVDEEMTNCIKCGKCVKVCPVNLQPLYISAYTEKKNWDMTEKYHPLDCIECGSCSYICPAKRPLVENIRQGKKVVMAFQKKRAK